MQSSISTVYGHPEGPPTPVVQVPDHAPLAHTGGDVAYPTTLGVLIIVAGLLSVLVAGGRDAFRSRR